MFQSTPPREGRRPLPQRCRHRGVCFNPRPHARGDMLLTLRFYLASCFNPRPHARGDKVGRIKRSKTSVSIHAPTRGATRFIEVRYLAKGVSIHAPTRGATFLLFVVLVTFKFQSTPPREGRRIATFKYIKYLCFNPRPHARGDI